MLFNSWQFGIFLPVVFALYWFLPNRFRWPVLLVSSYYFYMSWNVKYVVLILFTTVISYLAALLLDKFHGREGIKRLILWLTLVACLGVLFVFKYFNFFMESFSFMAGKVGIQLHPITLRLLLPVGISFYTFQTLAYVIDVYRGSIEPERHFGIYATFISFFPQLVAGPIERTRNLLPQIKDEHIFDYDLAMYGMREILWGFFKKIAVADVLAIYVDTAYKNLHHCTTFDLITVIFFFTVQIYCDFSGYSDIARGTAKLFGIKLMQNFNSPYFAVSIRDFWSRWHISLSTWFRDYVYIPLGGNRVSAFRHNLNLLTTFIVSGLWHGANWTFVFWGAIHGVAQVVEKIFSVRNRKDDNHNHSALYTVMQSFIYWLLVFVFCNLTWVFFRATNFSDAVYVLNNAFLGISGLRLTSHIGLSKLKLLFCFVNIGIIALFDFFSLKVDVLSLAEKHTVIAVIASYALLGLIFIALLFGNGANQFVYFQF